MAKIGIKSTVIATFLLLGISDIAKAQNIGNYEDYKLYCSPQAYYYELQSPECEGYKALYEQQLREELNQQEEIDSSEVNKRQNVPQENKFKGYAGISLGAFFPDEDLVDTGFGGSIFIGGQFNRNLGLDIDFGIAGGGTELEEVDYSVWGLFVNPRIIIPLDNQENSYAIYFSPGLGISQAEIDVDGGFDLEDSTRFSWQLKLGLSLPISDRYGSFAQVRYISQTEDDTIDFFVTEVGLSINF